MARTLVPLTKDVWISLGVGEMIITLHSQGRLGHVKLNQVEADEAALIVATQRMGDQFSNTGAADEIFAKATGDGWAVVVDI